MFGLLLSLLLVAVVVEKRNSSKIVKDNIAVNVTLKNLDINE